MIPNRASTAPALLLIGLVSVFCAPPQVDRAESASPETTDVAQSNAAVANRTPVTSAVPRTALPARPFGVWRLPVEDWGKPVSHLTRPVSFTTVRLTPENAVEVLEAARSNNMRVIVTFEGRPRPRDRAFDLEVWKQRFNAFCKRDTTGRRACVDLSPYINDGTIMTTLLAETGGDEQERVSAPTLAQIRAMGVHVKALFPNLKTAVDGSRPCSLKAPGRAWSSQDVEMVIINVFTAGKRSDANHERLIDEGIACAKRFNLEYAVDINPFLRANAEGLNARALAAFEHATKYALRAPGSQGTIIWRWWPGDSQTVTTGVRDYPNFWNERINPGIAATMRRIEACALDSTNRACM